MSLAARARQELLKFRWYGVTFVDWIGYLRRRRAFRTAATKTTVHHINKPIRHRSRHTFQIADDRCHLSQ